MSALLAAAAALIAACLVARDRRRRDAESEAWRRSMQDGAEAMRLALDRLVGQMPASEHQVRRDADAVEAPRSMDQDRAERMAEEEVRRQADGGAYEWEQHTVNIQVAGDNTLSTNAGSFARGTDYSISMRPGTNFVRWTTPEGEAGEDQPRERRVRPADAWDS